MNLDMVWRGSERIGFVPTVLCAIAWLVFGAIGVRIAFTSLRPTPRLVLVVGTIVATIVGIGGLVSFWLIADQRSWNASHYASGVITVHAFVLLTRDQLPMAFKMAFASRPTLTK